MHYYKFNIGDFDKITRHLSPLERGLFRDLLDMYISKEKPIISDLPKLQRLLCVKSKAEKDALQNVLDDYFDLTEAGFCSEFCQSILDDTLQKADISRENGKKGGRPSKADSNQSQSHDVANTKPNQSDVKADKNLEKTQTKPSENPNESYPYTHNPLPTTQKKNKYANEVAEVFEFWITTFAKDKNKTKLSDVRKRKIIQRLDDGFTLDDIKTAIVNCSKSEYHTAGGFTDIELICRDEQHFERFLNMKFKAQSSKTTDPLAVNDYWTNQYQSPPTPTDEEIHAFLNPDSTTNQPRYMEI